MSRFAIIIIIASVTAALGGCGNRRGAALWSRVEPRFDSLSAVIEHDFYTDSSLNGIDRKIARLQSMMPDDDPAAIARVLYWKAYISKNLGQTTDSRALLDSAATIASRAGLEYEAKRIRARILSNGSERAVTADNFLEAKELLQYFEQRRDTLTMATTLSYLGSALNDLNQPDEALDHYKRSCDLFDSLGYHNSASKMTLNIANVYLDNGRHDEGVKLLRTLEADTTLHREPAFMEVLWRNLYINDGDTAALHRGYAIANGLTGRTDLKTLYNNFMLHETDDDRYRRQVLADLDAVTIVGWRLNISETMTIYWRRRNNPAAALEWADSMNRYIEKYHEANRAAEIHSIDTRREIEMMEMKHDEETRRLFILFVIIVMSLALMCLSVVIFYSRKRNKARLRQKESELRLEKSMNHIAAAAVEMETRDHILQRLEHDIEQLNREEKLNMPDAKALTGLIRSTLRTDEEWQEFKRNYLNLSPEFFATLRATWPGLTQSQQNMLAYIRMGLNSKQIARVLMVRPESIHQSRWRLSRRLGLDPGETIEQRLSSIFDAPLLRRHRPD